MIMLANFLSRIFLYIRLLDRDQVGDEEATLDDEDENGLLKAFKVDSHMIYHIHSCHKPFVLSFWFFISLTRYI
jgi:hypothetical protein